MRARFKVTVPPGEVLPDDRDKVDCASDTPHVIAMKAVTRTGRLAKTDLTIKEYTPFCLESNSTRTHTIVSFGYVTSR